MKVLLIVLIAAAAALAADEKAPAVSTSSEAAKPAAVIPVELQMEYFRTDGALAHLKAELDRANAEYDAAVKAIVAACGEGAAPTLAQDKKRFFCVAQPAAAAAKKTP